MLSGTGAVNAPRTEYTPPWRSIDTLTSCAVATAASVIASAVTAVSGARGANGLPFSCVAPSLRLDTVTSELHRALDHDPVELAAVPNIGERESAIGLTDVLGLGFEVRRQEPAATGLDAIDRELRRDAAQETIRAVEPTREVELVPEEAVDP